MGAGNPVFLGKRSFWTQSSPRHLVFLRPPARSSWAPALLDTWSSWAPGVPGPPRPVFLGPPPGLPGHLGFLGPVFLGTWCSWDPPPGLPGHLVFLGIWLVWLELKGWRRSALLAWLCLQGCFTFLPFYIDGVVCFLPNDKRNWSTLIFQTAFFLLYSLTENVRSLICQSHRMFRICL